MVELLTSIGGIDLDEDDEAELDEDEIEGVANYAMAAAAVSAGASVFFELVADEDPGVRLAAPLALATLHGTAGPGARTAAGAAAGGAGRRGAARPRRGGRAGSPCATGRWRDGRRTG